MNEMIKKIQDNHTKLKVMSLTDEEIVAIVRVNKKLIDNVVLNLISSYPSITEINGSLHYTNGCLVLNSVNNIKISIVYLYQFQKLIANPGERLSSFCLENNIKENDLTNFSRDLTNLLKAESFIYFNDVKFEYQKIQNA